MEKLINNEDLYLKINENDYVLNLKKGKLSSTKANQLIDKLENVLNNLQLKQNSFHEKLILSRYIDNIYHACLDVKAINCSRYAFNRKGNVYSQLKERLDSKISSLKYNIRSEAKSKKEKDYLYLESSENSYLSIDKSYFLRKAQLSFEALEKVFTEIDSEFLESHLIDKKILKKQHSIYRGSYNKAKADLKVAYDLKEKAGNDLVNWTTHKVSRELNKINHNFHHVHSLISDMQENMKKEGVKQVSKNNKGKNKKESLETSFKNGEELSQKDLIYLFKNSRKLSYNSLIEQMNSESCDELLFSTLKGVNKIIKEEKLRTRLFKRITISKENYERSLDYSLKYGYNFTASFLNNFFQFVELKDITTQNYFTEIDSSILEDNASDHLYELIKNENLDSLIAFHYSIIKHNNKKENEVFFNDFFQGSLTINEREFLFLCQDYSVEELDSFFEGTDEEFPLKVQKWVKGTKRKDIFLKLLRSHGERNKVCLMTYLDAYIIKGFNKEEILEIFNLMTSGYHWFSEENTKLVTDLILHFKMKDFLLKNLSEVKSDTIKTIIFALSSKEELLESFNYNFGIKIDFNSIPENLQKDKEFLINLLNNCAIKQLNKNDIDSNLKESLELINRQDLIKSINLFAEHITKGNHLYHSEIALKYFTHTLNNNEWYTYLATNKNLFNNQLFLKIYKRIPKDLIKTFIEFEGSSSNEIKTHFGDIRARSRRECFNYLENILKDEEVESLDMYSLKIVYNNMGFKDKDISRSFSESWRSLSNHEVKSYVTKIAKKELINTTFSIDFLLLYYKEQIQKNLSNIELLSFINKEDRIKYKFLAINKNSLAYKHYQDEFLSKLDLNYIENGSKQLGSEILNYVFGSLNSTEDFLNYLGLEGKKLKKVFLSKLFQENDINISVIYKYLVLKNTMLKYDQIINELENEDIIRDTWMFKTFSMIINCSYEYFENLFKNKLFFKRNYNQIYKMLNYDKQNSDNQAYGMVSAYTTLEDTIKMLNDHKMTIQMYLDLRSKKSIKYFHDQMKSIILKKGTPNFKFRNVRKNISLKNLKRLNKKYLSEYKVIPVKSMHELIYHSTTLGHCVGTAGYHKDILKNDKIIFAVKKGNKLLYTAEYHLKTNKLGQVEGKSYSTLEDKQKTELQKLITKSIISQSLQK